MPAVVESLPRVAALSRPVRTIPNLRDRLDQPHRLMETQRGTSRLPKPGVVGSNPAGRTITTSADRMTCEPGP